MHRHGSLNRHAGRRHKNNRHGHAYMKTHEDAQTCCPHLVLASSQPCLPLYQLHSATAAAPALSRQARHTPLSGTLLLKRSVGALCSFLSLSLYPESSGTALWPLGTLKPHFPSQHTYFAALSPPAFSVFGICGLIEWVVFCVPSCSGFPSGM